MRQLSNILLIASPQYRAMYNIARKILKLSIADVWSVLIDVLFIFHVDHRQGILTNNNYFQTEKEVLLVINRSFLFQKMSFLDQYIHFCPSYGVMKYLLHRRFARLLPRAYFSCFQLLCLDGWCCCLLSGSTTSQSRDHVTLKTSHSTLHTSKNIYF